MGLTIIFIALLIAASVNAGFVWQDDDHFPGKPNMKFFNNNFGRFPTFPTPPPFPHFTFPTFPTIPPMVLLSPEDIIKNKGPNFNGVSVSTYSSSSMGSDGKMIRKGDSTIIINEGGKVKKFTTGNDPTKVNVESQPQIIVPKKPIWQPIIPIIPLDPEVIKVYQPEANEHFIGTSSAIYSQTSDVNGIKSKAGGSKIITNYNGNVAEKIAEFRDNNV